MAGLGVPQQLIELQPKADPCCVNYIDYAQAKAWGLVSDRSAKELQAMLTPTAAKVRFAPIAVPPKITDGIERGISRLWPRRRPCRAGSPLTLQTRS